MVFKKTLEGPLDCKEIQPVSSKGNQSRIFIDRIDADLEAQIIWPPDANNWLIGKDPNAGKDWRQEEKRTIENETVGWHRWDNGLEFEQALGTSERQGSLFSRNPWGCKESDTTEPLNWTGNKLRNSVKIVFYNRCCLWLFELQMNIPCW